MGWHPHLCSMKTLLVVLIGVVMLAVVGVLVAGVIGMVRGGDPYRSNRLMQYRVMLQGVAILLFIVLLSLLRS